MYTSAPLILRELSKARGHPLSSPESTMDLWMQPSLQNLGFEHQPKMYIPHKGYGSRPILSKMQRSWSEQKGYKSDFRETDLAKGLPKIEWFKKTGKHSHRKYWKPRSDKWYMAHESPGINDLVQEEALVSSNSKEEKVETKRLLSHLAKPLSMDYSEWEIVQNTVVAAHKHANFGYILIYPGKISYGIYKSTNVLNSVEYDYEEIQKKDGQLFSIEGGGLPSPIIFEQTERDTRDKCFDDMKRWGMLWRNRAEDDIVDTKEILFWKTEGDIGVEMEQDMIKKVRKDTVAERRGVQVGWRILKIGDNWVDPSTFIEGLNLIDALDFVDGKYTITFATTTPWAQEIKAEFMKKFLLREYWRESILSACKLTSHIFTGYLVTRTIEEWVSTVIERVLDPGYSIAVDFMDRLCFTARDSLMSRTILSALNDEWHSETLNRLAIKTKQYFSSPNQVYTDTVFPPAICHLLSRLFGLELSIKHKFHPGRALNVWFRGVNLHFLQKIQHGIQKEWSTEDVKNKYILDATADTKTMLMADLATVEDRGPASMFISHAWSNRYYYLVEACKQYPDQLFFNDIIAIQQHRTEAEEQEKDLEVIPAIISHSATVLLISDMKLKPLNRIWCLFELYHCLVTMKSKLVVEFTSEGLKDESDVGLWNATKDIEDLISNIDVVKARATVKADKDRILKKIISKVPGGIEMFNMQLIAALKMEWSKNLRQKWGWRMMETVGRSVRKAVELEEKLVEVEKLENELLDLKDKYANMETRLREIEMEL